ncbi:lipopolysaccharide core heptose(I) kinase RfaP [soil metagenome]
MSNLKASIGTPLLVTRLTRGNLVLHAQPDFEAAAGDFWHKRIMQAEITDKLHQKQGRSIARWTLPGLSLFLKRHYILPWRHGLGAILFPGSAWSPGLQEWHNLKWAEGQGLPVPRAVAAAEWRGPGLKLQSFLAVEELAGMLPLHEAIPLAQQQLNATDFAAWKRRLVHELARLSAELHRRHAFHKDLYLCHFYVAEEHCRNVPKTFRGATVMIDFHRLGHHRLTGPWFQVKDLAQLLYSTVKVPGVTNRDRLRFWKLYQQRVNCGSWVKRAVLLKYRLYLRHARRVAARKQG